MTTYTPNDVEYTSQDNECVAMHYKIYMKKFSNKVMCNTPYTSYL